MRIPDLPDPPMTVTIVAGPYPEARALEKARQEFGPRVEVGHRISINHKEFTYEVKETTNAGD